MKNPFLKFVMATTLIVAVAAGCSSTEKAAGSDTTATDSSTMLTDTTQTPVDTMMMDTTKKDTVKM